MKTQFKSSFAKDLSGIKDKKLHQRVKALIQLIEESDGLSAVTGLKKLRARGGYYRIRVGEYRLGLTLKGKVVTFVRCLDRKEIYRYFP